MPRVQSLRSSIVLSFSWLWQLSGSMKTNFYWPHTVLRTRKLVIMDLLSSTEIPPLCHHPYPQPSSPLCTIYSYFMVLTPNRPFNECLAWGRILPIPLPRLRVSHSSIHQFICCQLHFLQENTHYPSGGKGKMPICLQMSRVQASIQISDFEMIAGV